MDITSIQLKIIKKQLKYFCTLSDINYLPLGLSMYESLLLTTSEDFILYYLCLDEESFIKINNIKDSKIQAIKLDDLINSNNDLSSYKTSERREFIWMLASYFSDYLMKNNNIEHIVYIDSDIYFYDDIDIFYKEIGNRSVGIIRHRQIPEDMNSGDGKYNVGIVYFKNDNVGKYCLNWWKDAVLNRKYPNLASCYDQKYLEGFLMMFNRDQICVADESFAHSAPWHHRLYDWSSLDIDNTVLWENKKQILLFNHFSRISFDTEKDTYLPSGGNYPDHTLNFSVFEIPQIKRIHDDYFNIIKKTKIKYSL